jgi:hypothetical protein
MVEVDGRRGRGTSSWRGWLQLGLSDIGVPTTAMSWFGCGCKQDVLDGSESEDELDLTSRDLPLDVRRMHGMLVSKLVSRVARSSSPLL